MEIKLSFDSDALICVLYAEYLNRRDHNVPIDRAVCFQSDIVIHRDYFPDWLQDDVTTVCYWLYARDLITGCPGDDHLSDVQLTEDGIIYMESRFSRKREKVLSHIRSLVKIGISVAAVVFA